MSALMNLKMVESMNELHNETSDTKSVSDTQAGISALAAAKRDAMRYRPIAGLVTDEETAGLRMPVTSFLIEGEELLTSARAFEARLLGIGLRRDALIQLEDLLAGVRLCQSIVTLGRTYDDRSALDAVIERSLVLREEILEAADLAFLANGPIQAEFEAIASVPVNEDLRGILYTLERLVVHHGAALRRVLLDDVGVAAELRELLVAELEARGQLERERADGTWKELRDKLCVITSGVAAEVRAHGKYLCRNDEPRRQLFTSRWVRERNRKQRLAARAKTKASKEPAPETPPSPGSPPSPGPTLPDWSHGIDI